MFIYTFIAGRVPVEREREREREIALHGLG